MMNVNKWHFILSALVLCSDPGEARHQTLSCPKSLLHPNNDHIDCSDENLTRVPHNPVLTAVALDLSYNKLIVVRNKELLNTGYVNIEELFMYNNNINRLEDEAFRDLTKLTSVSMQHNRLTVINKDILKNNLNLQILVLSFNPLTLPSSDTVSLINSTSLTHLYLSNCNLTRVTRGLFTETPNLTMLDVSYNKLTTFNWVPFKHLHQVQRLFLEHNQIRNVECDHEMLFSLTELYISAPESETSKIGGTDSIHTMVYLRGNPLKCDCCWTLTAFGLRKRSVQLEASCKNEGSAARDIDEPNVTVKLRKCFVNITEELYNTNRELKHEVEHCRNENKGLLEGKSILGTKLLKFDKYNMSGSENQLKEMNETNAGVTRKQKLDGEQCEREIKALETKLLESDKNVTSLEQQLKEVNETNARVTRKPRFEVEQCEREIIVLETKLLNFDTNMTSLKEQLKKIYETNTRVTRKQKLDVEHCERKIIALEIKLLNFDKNGTSLMEQLKEKHETIAILVCVLVLVLIIDIVIIWWNRVPIRNCLDRIRNPFLRCKESSTHDERENITTQNDN